MDPETGISEKFGKPEPGMSNRLKTSRNTWYCAVVGKLWIQRKSEDRGEMDPETGKSEKFGKPEPGMSNFDYTSDLQN